MPSKGTKLRNGDRYNLLSRDLYKYFCEKTKVEISYIDFKKIIDSSTKLIREKLIKNPQGFKFPESLGICRVSKYKPKSNKRNIDWLNTKLHGTLVYHNNFHSFGYKSRIMWYTKNIAVCKNIDTYKFVPDRLFQRGVAAQMKQSVNYDEINYSDLKNTKLRINKIR